MAVGPVKVTKKSGDTKCEEIDRLGRLFQVDGRAVVYGYLRPSPRPHRQPANYGPGRCGNCGAPGTLVASLGLACANCYDDMS
jgi:hypothetical protein